MGALLLCVRQSSRRIRVDAGGGRADEGMCVGMLGMYVQSERYRQNDYDCGSDKQQGSGSINDKLLKGW